VGEETKCILWNTRTGAAQLFHFQRTELSEYVGSGLVIF
jgi:hypothetical protein